MVTDLEHVLRTAAEARQAAPPPSDERYQKYCAELGLHLRRDWDAVMAANAQDVARATAAGLSAELVDRLTVTERHLESLVSLTERTGQALPGVIRAGEPIPAGNGMTIHRQPKAIGVLLMIYEARPTVTIEGALLPVAVGNVSILRGGTETASTNAAFGALAATAAAAAGLPAGMVQVLSDVDRAGVRWLLKQHASIDVLIPRGSPTLIEFCQSASTIPVIASGGGVNHLYVDASADLELAARLALDSKLTEPTACNTLEMVLAHEEIAVELTRRIVEAGRGDPVPWVLRVDPRLVEGGRVTGSSFDRRESDTVKVTELGDHDAGREFLDRSLGVRPVTGLTEALGYVRTYGSRHTEGIVAQDPAVIARYLAEVDAAGLVVNGSLRLHDGPTMGLGAELSIGTGRLHVRGPVNLSALLTYSWVIEGHGMTRDALGEQP